jgi:hypothetical protein
MSVRTVLVLTSSLPASSELVQSRLSWSNDKSSSRRAEVSNMLWMIPAIAEANLPRLPGAWTS